MDTPSRGGRAATLREVFGLPQLVLLAVLGGMGPLGTDMYLASLPEVAHDFDATAATVQVTLTGFLVGLAAGQLILGPLSDRFGRYRLLVTGVAVLVASSVLCALAPSVGLLIAARVVQGLSGAAALVLSRAIAADLATGSLATRVFSVLTMITGVAPIVAPIIGGLIQQWSHWRVVFWVLTVLGTALLAGILLLVRETLPPERRHARGVTDTLVTAGRILADRQFLGFGISIWFGFATLFSYISASPFVIEGLLGFSPIGYTIVFAVNAGGLTAAAATSAAWERRLGAPWFARLGTIVQLVGAAGIGAVALTGLLSVWTILPAFFLIATGQGFITGNATALSIERMGHARGTALALVGCLQFAIGGAMAPLVGLAGAHSVVPLAIVSLTCGVIALGGVHAGIRARRRTDPA